jgi:1-acyl-sn-glycerol-3-phosphate acyltransferase
MTVPTISTTLLRFFRRIVRGYFRRHFHAVRICGAKRLASDDGPLIIYANHSSWWDPMVSVLLAECFLPKRHHYAPMDAEALQQYGILKRLGIFPVEMKTTRGAVQFLNIGEAILASGGVLWVTPQGRFADARERPLAFKKGLAALARRVAEHSGSCTLLPLAIEYPFWEERLPETLLHLGEAVRFSGSTESADAVQLRLERALESAMEELKELSFKRDAACFTTLVGGSSSVGGFYALGQRIRAFLQRRPYQAGHTATTKSNAVRE